MTDETPTHPISPGSEPVDADIAPVDPQDVRLSAELDGEAAPEAEPGAPTPVDAERRQELASARDLLAIPPQPLDDVTRRRMLRTAISELPPARSRGTRSMHRMMAAAAVLAVVVIGGATLKALDNGSDNHSKSSSASKSAASATTAVPPSSSRDLHEISDPEVLRSRVESLLRAAPAPTAAHRSTQSTSVAADGSTGASTERSKDNAESSAGVVGTNCLSSVRVPAGATPSVLADATFDGAPAVVVVAHDGPRILIYVLAKNDCRLLTSQFLKE